MCFFITDNWKGVELRPSVPAGTHGFSFRLAAMTTLLTTIIFATVTVMFVIVIDYITVIITTIVQGME